MLWLNLEKMIDDRSLKQVDDKNPLSRENHPLFEVTEEITTGRTSEIPLRSEILSREALILLANTLGNDHDVTFYPRHADTIYPRFEENVRILEKAYFILADAAKTKQPLTPGGEWLLDNYHLVEQQIKEIRKLLPKGYYKKLPTLASSFSTIRGTPRVYALVLAIISHTDAVVEEALLSDFIAAYQSKQLLSIGELWAFPIMLRLALIENLRRLSAITLAARDAEQRIAVLIEKILGNTGQGSEERMGTTILLDLAAVIKEEGEELTHAASAFIIRQLRAYGPQGALALHWFEQWLAEKGLTEKDSHAEDLLREEWLSKAANQISIGNSFTSLKAILSIDWLTWFEKNSAVDAMFRQDPLGIYEHCDFTTRNRYRSQIEQLAQKLKRPEIEIAASVLSFTEEKAKIALAQKETHHETPPEKLSHIGYYLIDEGAPLFKKHLDLESTIWEKVKKPFPMWLRFPLYLFAISIATIVLLFVLNLSLSSSQLSIPVYATALFLLFFLVNDLGINIVHWIAAELLPPSLLPKLDLSAGVPAAYRTIVAVHSILRDQETITKAVEFLEVRFLANSDSNILFALLADLPDADTEVTPEDSELIEFATLCVEELNKRYFAKKQPQFFLLTRKRVWNSSQGRFISWEKKRGKVMEFNRLLLGFEDTSLKIEVGDPQFLTDIKYVITLDADTALPHGSAKRMIATIAHPLNAPTFASSVNASPQVVTEGYGIIQPRLSVSLASAQATLFSKIFAGDGGVDPYTLAVSDIYQDYFHEGSFFGKGIYDLQAFARALEGRVPENTLLSHDLFEGLFARAGLATDIELYDEFPRAYNTFAKRQHRWVRGDWQLLPWIIGKAPTRSEIGKTSTSKDSSISPLGQWKLLDNLRRSLIAPLCFIFLIFSWAFLPDSPLWWTGIVFIVIAFPVYAQLATTIITSPFGMSFSGYARECGRKLKNNFIQAVLIFIFLPYQALLMSHAIGITLYRLFVSKKNLLDWETAYQAERRLGTGFGSFLREMLLANLSVLLTAILLATTNPSQLIFASPILCLWFLSPWVAYWISNPHTARGLLLTDEKQERLQKIAFKTWKFFDDLASEETHYLIPDNVQLFPKRVVAYRTSPSNIGLHYLSILTAVDLGFITPLEAGRKIRASLETLMKLEKLNGHFYNWYDIRSLTPLEPRYVSTVDSGNLIGHLIVVKNGARELLSKPSLSDDSEERLELLTFITTTCELIIKNTDFKFLYNKERKLFTIGYQVTEGKFDNSYYDLLASEARLTSLLAIAKGDIPLEHWFVLGRPLTRTPGGKALLSWSGTMFEYLMPLLVTKDFPNTILHETYKAIVETQRIYARTRGVPWGISESGYAGVDFEHTYQYRAFGVPGLGLKRGLSEDFVISPYSTFLAMMVTPHEALKNISRLEDAGLSGEYGFYESIDYTSERLSREEGAHIVRSFLAHHQGMILLSLNNVLNENILQTRFHSDPLIRAVEPLLQEKFPERSPLTVPHHAEITYTEQQEEGLKETWSETITTPHTILPRTRVLSNGFYSLMIDNAGSGFSFIPGMQITRWHEDSLRNYLGNYVFVKDLDTNKIWSLTYQPSRQQPEFYEVIYNPDKVEFKRRDFDIALHTEITISPEDNVEVKKITVTNLSRRNRNLQFTSFAEICLNAAQADAVHPAFSKLFVESEFVPEIEALIFTRRPRSADEARTYLLTMLSMPIVWGKVEYETNREAFIGRGRNINHPIVFDEKNRSLSSTIGTVLDPIASLRTRVEIQPSSSQTLSFITAIGKTREDVLFLAERYNDTRTVTRAFEMAWSKSNIEFRTEQISIRQSHLYQHLANALFFQHKVLRCEPQLLLQNRLQQSGLWRLSISGDLPIVLVSITDLLHLKLVRELLKAHEYLRHRNVFFDLVIINEHGDGYLQNVSTGMEQLLRSVFPLPPLETKGGVFVRTLKQISAEEYLLLKAVARVVFCGEGGSLEEQLELPGELEGVRATRRGLLDYLFKEETPSSRDRSGERSVITTQREFDNGYGGFIENGKAYALTVHSEKLTPAPWINVIANPQFGFTVSESGSGYTWSENSRENRLTPWSNDPVSDRPGEVIYIRDGNTGAFWCPTPLPVRNRGRYGVEHHQGFSKFKLLADNIFSELTISGSLQERVKWWHVKLQNRDNRIRRLEVYLYVEWVLGVLRAESQAHIVTSFDSKLGMLAAQNHYNNEFASRVVFLGSNTLINSYTTSRAEFMGRNHTLSSPLILEQAVTAPSLVNLAGMANLSRLVNLRRVTGAGHDSCGVLKVVHSLNAEEECEVMFFMGEAPNLGEARQNVKRYRKTSYRKSELQAVSTYWDSLSSAVEVKTPDRSFDLLLNSWLLYQCLSSRIYGRTGFYQSGGAFGFRDQLQDGLALLYSKPEIARSLILQAASRQFLEGDVQHWWHPPTGRGVRTRISDDYLWLPYVVERYLEATGDHAILEEQVSFIEAPLLDPTQMDAYLQPHLSPKADTLYVHCLLALQHGLRFGEHGLPLIGAGDWNDGFNEIGREGKGESIWLGWFLLDNLQKWAAIAAVREDLASVDSFQMHAKTLLAALEEHGWDGNWYRRAYFDDGTPLGSESNTECQIDSIAQSWAVISKRGDPTRSRQAMNSLLSHLVNEKDKLVLLLTPPFDKGELNPGYLKGYPPGVRENGAQYTHAAAWVVIAAAMLKMGDISHQLFSIINPINHTKNTTAVERYRGEPYVVCGDVYSKPPYSGRAGWSWYTGSCGWLYQAGISNILGLQLHGTYFTISPCIPADWRSYSIHYRHQNVLYKIEVKNPDGVEHGVLRTEVNGVEIPDGRILYSVTPGVSEVSVQVIMGERPAM